MRRLVRLSSRRLFWLWLACLCMTLLAGLALAQPQAAGAAANSAQATPTATAHSDTATENHTTTASQPSPASTWLAEGLGIVFLLLLGFGLIIFPIAVRSARIERRSRPAFSLVPVVAAEQVSRLGQIAPERKEPLNRQQMLALQEAARGRADSSQPSATTLTPARLIDGVPISLPISEAEAVPQLPAPRRPAVTHKIDDGADYLA
ncbi:MAG TPA: hypothetical protein VFU69_09005 [Ktedonobacterales bacterium]|nr:hypothetical protein [Ktedonobacterales bacterium]